MRIVVTGIGVVSALGIGKDANLEALLNERCGIATPSILNTAHSDLPVGEVKYTNDELKSLVGIDLHNELPRTTLLGILAAKEAIVQANIIPNKQTAFISGTTVGGMDLTEQHWEQYKAGEHTHTIAMHEAGKSTELIAQAMGNFGFVSTPSTACSSALNSIMMGCDMLRTGMIRKAVVGGSESLSLFHFNGFRSLMILDKEQCRPFDVSRAGLNLGEGAGYLVIETEESAIERGAEILAYISGYANTCDAFHQTASSQNGEGAYLAMTKALEMSGLHPSDIDYVKAHGTGTPNNDSSESAALERVFGDRMPDVSSTKSFTGHTTSACGGVESVFCILAMQQGFIPANLNWNNSADDTITPNRHTLKKQVKNILCNAFGFGGNESSVIFSLEPKELSTATTSEYNIKLLASVEQTSLDDQAEYFSSLEARRMTPQIRRIVIAAYKALKKADIEIPDAIVCATRWGCMQQSMRFLIDMLQSNEQEVKPTYFMQSTHNTISATIAIRLHCHGYNTTYSQGYKSLECAMTDIKTQMALGRIKTALILEFDERVDEWDKALNHVSEQTQDIARAYIYTT